MANETENLSHSELNPNRSPIKWTRFPKERAAVVRLQASPSTRLVLTAILEFVDGEGYCWPSHELLAERARVDNKRAPRGPGKRDRFVTVDRACKELRALGVLSWHVLGATEQLPNGTLARRRRRVLRVDIEALRSKVGLVSLGAKHGITRDQIDPVHGIKMIPSPPPLGDVQTPEIAAEPQTSVTLNNRISLVKTLIEQQNDRNTNPAAHPGAGDPDTRAPESSASADRVAHAWLLRIWQWRFGEDVPALEEHTKVRAVAFDRLSSGAVSEAQLLDAIEGARISPFCLGTATGRECWGAGIFKGPLPRLIALGVQQRRNAQRRVALAEAKPAASRPAPQRVASGKWAALPYPGHLDDTDSSSEVDSKA